MFRIAPFTKCREGDDQSNGMAKKRRRALPNFRREPPFLCGSSASIPIGKGKEPLRALNAPQRLLHF